MTMEIGFNSADLSLSIRYFAIRPADRAEWNFRAPQRGYIQMFPGDRFATATTAFLLITGGFFLLLFSTAQSPAAAASDGCASPAETSCRCRWRPGPARRCAGVAEKPVEGVLSLIASDGSVAVKLPDRHDGPPYSWFAEVAAPAAGTWHATLERDRTSTDCSPVTRSGGGFRDGLQSKRLRGAPLGGAREQRRGIDMHASCATGAAHEDVGIPRLVPRTALAGAQLTLRACRWTPPCRGELRCRMLAKRRHPQAFGSA